MRRHAPHRAAAGLLPSAWLAHACAARLLEAHLERVMCFEVSAKRPVARRDKPCAAAPPPGQGAQRGIGAHRALSGGSAANASHLNVHNTL
ncbi:conserved exported hypothetical protein [Xanthomonas citri pv. fuscans]|nr:conserved exported hypothetical protein [Xanthomonas citri pv. fuscans]SON99594.1 conserved exported hypothetical protein [Xanthomonas citri pv. fuscans]SOO05801.1 conserved exported hypothetical protein [Xanthomonas citri pv. fuscans]SOO07288.1 conserved exported hypothetical protein [Xanthomonas citri pv. fuscans]SOO13583.1 conserved exported hypothetical protein [Xanthomonas citri pv. fuscans]